MKSFLGTDIFSFLIVSVFTRVFFTLLKSSEREKNKIKSVFDKVFPVAPVATLDAFFWGEKKASARSDAKVGASDAEGAARRGGVEGVARVKTARRRRLSAAPFESKGERGCLNDRIGSLARIAKKFSKKGRGGVPNCASSDYH